MQVFSQKMQIYIPWHAGIANLSQIKKIYKLMCFFLLYSFFKIECMYFCVPKKPGLPFKANRAIACPINIRVLYSSRF